MKLFTLTAAGIVLSIASLNPVMAGQSNHGLPVSWASVLSNDPLPLVNGEPLPKGKLSLVWQDEFATLSVTRDTKAGGTGPWYAPVHAQLGIGTLAVPPDPAISIVNGNLLLQTRNAGGKWTDTNIQTVDSTGKGFTIQNGYIDFRILLSNGHGSHGGIWLLSNHDKEKGHVEIDLAETYGPGDPAIHQCIHLWPGTASTYPKHVYNSFYIRPAKVPTLLQQFHNIGILLTDTEISTYYDGKNVSSIPRLPEEKVPLYLLLSNFTDAHRKDGYSQSKVFVDYVRAYSVQ